MLAGLLFVPVLSLGSTLATSTPAFAANPDCTKTDLSIQDAAWCAAGGAKNTGPSCLFGDGCVFTTVINFALYFIGAISVLMLIVGGVRYTLSGGNEKSVSAAKNTILYAVIGVVVAILAWAIVNFVITTLVSNP